MEPVVSGEQAQRSFFETHLLVLQTVSRRHATRWIDGGQPKRERVSNVNRKKSY